MLLNKAGATADSTEYNLFCLPKTTGVKPTFWEFNFSSHPSQEGFGEPGMTHCHEPAPTFSLSQRPHVPPGCPGRDPKAHPMPPPCLPNPVTLPLLPSPVAPFPLLLGGPSPPPPVLPREQALVRVPAAAALPLVCPCKHSPRYFHGIHSKIHSRDYHTPAKALQQPRKPQSKGPAPRKAPETCHDWTPPPTSSPISPHTLLRAVLGHHLHPCSSPSQNIAHFHHVHTLYLPALPWPSGLSLVSPHREPSRSTGQLGPPCRLGAPTMLQARHPPRRDTPVLAWLARWQWLSISFAFLNILLPCHLGFCRGAPGSASLAGDPCFLWAALFSSSSASPSLDHGLAQSRFSVKGHE